MRYHQFLEARTLPSRSIMGKVNRIVSTKTFRLTGGVGTKDFHRAARELKPSKKGKRFHKIMKKRRAQGREGSLFRKPGERPSIFDKPQPK
jgi:hypothetical protein